MTSATKKRKQIDLPISQFIAIIVLSISIFLIIDFGRRAATGYRIGREEDKLQIQLLAAKKNQQQLLARRDYITTDAYIEEIARNELKWSRPNETVVVIMPTPETFSRSRASAPLFTTMDHHQDTPFQAWVTLFFPDPQP